MQEFKAQGRHHRFLTSDELSTFQSRLWPDMYLEVALWFGDPNALWRHTLRDFSHLSDWLNRNDWPPELVPFAVYDPADDEQEERFICASASEAEEFLAITGDDDGAVYLWTHDAGFHLIANSLDEFLDTHQ